MSETSRRTMLKAAAVAGGAAGVGLVAWTVAGRTEWLSPREATARKLPLRTLTDAEAAALDAFGEVLLPGARDAGLVQFVDKHLAAPPADCLMTIRYLDVPPPYAAFYKGGLAALDTFAGGRFAGLAPDKASEVVKAIATTVPAGWKGPPAPLLYFAVRGDAVDVVYGTDAGFQTLGVPSMTHIAPDMPW